MLDAFNPHPATLASDLTDAQREAVEHVEGPLLILAGPGSGKTRVVTHRIAHLLNQGVRERQILALTFTNKAAEEMRARVEALVPGADVWIGTFHRFCARLLRRHAALVGLGENYTIYDTDDSRRLIRKAIEKLGLDPTHYTPDQVSSAIRSAKNRLQRPESFEGATFGMIQAILLKVYPVYQQLLRDANAADFDDLLAHVAAILHDNPELRADLDARYRYVLVDEYQDTNHAQYAIVRALSIDYPNLAVTGDPDQSIYGWRGANIGNILDFEKDYPRVRIVRLEQNYRSTRRILKVAETLIANNLRRKPKALFTANEEGTPVRLMAFAGPREEADAIAYRVADGIRRGGRTPREFAVFYRTNALSRPLESAFREQGLPFQIVAGVEFYQRKEIKDVIGYLRLMNNPSDREAFLRVVNTPLRGIGASSLKRLDAFADRERIPLLEAARSSERIEGLPKRAGGALAKFAALMDRLSAGTQTSVRETINDVLEESGYRRHLLESPAEEDQDRLANVNELVTAAGEFDEHHPHDGGLEAFLEEAGLRGETDAWSQAEERVCLMTLHAAKGLEFPVVFIVGLEEGILPHERCRDHPDQVEEERRLLFVGITRSKQELYLSRSLRRLTRGRDVFTIPSAFLVELPREEMLIEGGAVESGWDAAAAATDEMGDEQSDASVDESVDADFDIDEIERKYKPEPPPTRRPPVESLTTAAELGGRGTSTAAIAAPIAVDAFAPGMAVDHPEYGRGTILDVGGSGLLKSATVEFSPPTGRRKFILSKSKLKPV